VRVAEYVVDPAEGLGDNHAYVRQYLKEVSDSMKAHYDRLAISVGFQEETRSDCP
jgi:hypothetical protein